MGMRALVFVLRVGQDGVVARWWGGLVAVLALVGIGVAMLVGPARSVLVGSPCAHPAWTRLSYGWPIKPFHRQHPIRGYFGDPRTLAWEGQPGLDSELTPGSFSFHNGVDIVARCRLVQLAPSSSRTVRVCVPAVMYVTTLRQAHACRRPSTGGVTR
jgi:hypothetical protein